MFFLRATMILIFYRPMDEIIGLNSSVPNIPACKLMQSVIHMNLKRCLHTELDI